jgi:hypothetical protein
MATIPLSSSATVTSQSFRITLGQKHRHRQHSRDELQPEGGLIAAADEQDAAHHQWAIEAIQDYNPEPELDKIKAKVLLINDAEDHANPPELGTVERAMKRVKHGRYVLMPAGPNTHGHFSHFYAELWKPYLIEFMQTLGTPLQAAAE